MFDLIIQPARICDGTGNPSFVGTLGVTDLRSTYLGGETGLAARRTMNADGPVVTPRFIDSHTHYDAQMVLMEWTRHLGEMAPRSQNDCSAK
jgi:N-acyl-D-amino-acid deacylase